jgi:serine/threonine-protein kinase RsbW
MPELKDSNLRSAQPDERLAAPATSDAASISPPADSSLPHRTTFRQELEFPGVLASIPEHRERIMEFVSAHCADEGDRIDILVAVQEALANAALHGCKDDPLKRIRCLLTADESEITITVSDPGPGFDLALADPERYQATTLSQGRGICLMRNLMSEVRFASGGSEILLRKRIQPAR